MADIPPITDTLGNPYVVRLFENSVTRVIFKVSPELVESRTVNYSSTEPVHMPGHILTYKNTQARAFSINGIKLISRTPKEASDNLNTLWILRGWTMPRFGINSSTNTTGTRLTSSTNGPVPTLTFTRNPQLLGSPPAVLLLSAYSNTNIEHTQQHIQNVPVVLQSLNIPYPTDVDYILTTTGVPMPSVMIIDISLMESHSAQEYEKFSLDSYKAGTLKGF